MHVRELLYICAMTRAYIIRYAVLFLLLALAQCSPARNAGKKTTQYSPVEMVDLFMGVRGNSNCSIGPQLPHGSVNPGPQTRNGGQNAYSEHEPISGFAQLHVSGIGWSRYGMVLLSPQTGFAPGEEDHYSDKADEVAKPYYYAVTLSRYGIRAELAPTHHAAIYRFTQQEGKTQNLLVDIRHSIAREVHGRFHGGSISYDRHSHELTGWGTYSGGFGAKDPYKVYFAIRLDKGRRHGKAMPLEVDIVSHNADSLYARISNLPAEVSLRVGVSLRSIANARAFLHEEVMGETLESISRMARTRWDDMLGRIRVEGGTDAQRRIFYTALYHSLVMPRERTGDNPFWNTGQPHIDDHYCVWDTWRTCYPLLTLIDQSFVTRTINSFIDRLKHDGMVTPTYVSSQEWPQNQGGNDVDNIIADAILKDVPGFDRKAAYAVMLHDALHMGDSAYRRLGWIPGRHVRMSCSYTMEYAYNDDCTSRIAALMGDGENARLLGWRSRQWVNLFNPDLRDRSGIKGFIGPREADGTFISIDPAHIFSSWDEYFYEGNSWTYTLFTPSQFDRLIALCGGKEKMVKRLRYGFDSGHVAIWNEPGFLAPFIFCHCGRPDLASRYVRRLREDGYSLEKGYPDNEDSGAMGSWYVFTSMGLFPNAGQDFYYVLPPAFRAVTLTMEDGRTIRIENRMKDASSDTISRLTVNGKDHPSLILHHREIAGGAVITVE